MFHRIAKRSVALMLGIGLLIGLQGAANSAPLEDSSKTNGFKLLTPGQADGRIAFVTAKMLEQLQYDRRLFRDDISSQFLDKYLETLDPQHLHFLQSDLAEFEKYRTNLDVLTIPRTQVADVRPGFHIFHRFVQRLEERVQYSIQLLTNGPLTFDAEERVMVNRREMPYPKDAGEAHQLWRDRLRYEYLQEKLGLIETAKKAAKDDRPTVVATNGVAKADAKPKTDHEKIVDILSQRSQRNLRMFRDWDSDDVMQIYLTTLARVYDPHSDYFGPEQLESFSIGMNLSLCGIGAELRYEDGYCTINRILPGGPAEKSKKVREKDRIVAVAQSNQPPVDIVDMALNKAVQLIRGPKGSEVTLTIVPAGKDTSERMTLALVRDEIKLDDQAAKAKVIELPAGETQETLRLGVIDLPSFYASFDPGQTRGKQAEPRSTSADVAKLLGKLKKERIDGLVLDLRRNGGGSLEEAIRLTGLFIKEGPVVLVRDAEGGVVEDRDTDPAVLYDGPLVVLTSRFSASASEILAGALQDYGRALIVGDAATHGKGTVQSVNTLKPFMRLGNVVWTNDPGALKVTIKKFYRASGASTQLKGVIPDIVLPSVVAESKDFGESAVDNPMPWDTIPSAEFQRLPLVEAFVSDLRKRSNDRIATNREYDFIRDDIARFRKIQEDKTVSLNEKERLREKQEADERAKARRKERLARPEGPEKLYEVTLKNLDTPGLVPMPKTNDTNRASSAVSDAHGLAGVEPGAGGDDDEAGPTVDPVLDEARNVLVDYINALRKSSVLTAGQGAKAAGQKVQ